MMTAEYTTPSGVPMAATTSFGLFRIRWKTPREAGLNGDIVMAKTLGYLITWTRGYDKRFCFDRTALKQKIKYVQDHDE